MKRRDLLYKLLLTGTAFSSGYMLSQYLSKKEGKETIIDGEEWRKVEELYANELASYRTNEEVLKQASINIEQLRKKDFKLVLESIVPEQIQQIEIELVDHAYDFGNSSAGSVASENIRNNHNYSKFFKDIFNCTTAKCY